MLNKFFVFIFFIFYIFGALYSTENVSREIVFKKIAVKLSEVSKKLNKKTVAVYGFDMIGRSDDSYALYATEKLTHELVDTDELLVIERSKINKVLKEQKLGMTGIINAADAARIGKIMAVEGVVIGSIKVTEKQVEILARVVQSDTGIILKSANFSYQVKSVAKIKKNDDKPQPDPDNNLNNDVIITLSQPAYNAKQPIIINFKGLPGNRHDWITLVPSSAPDRVYKQWFYTYGKKSGSYTFKGVSSGNYEVRVYFNWPAGGYMVMYRKALKVH